MRPSLPFDQRDALVVPVHQQRNADADGQVDAHGDGHGFDRLAGLVEHRAGEQRHHVRVADGRRQRGVLRQVEVLAGQRRNDHAQGLRHYHQPQHPTGSQPQRGRRFGLAMAYRLDAGTYGFTNEGRGVDRQCQHDRHQLGNHHPAATDIEAPQLGNFPEERPTEQQRTQPGNPDEQPEADPEHGKGLPGGMTTGTRPTVEQDDGDQRQPQRHPERPEAFTRTGRRHLYAAIVDEDDVPQTQAVTRSRQRAEYGEVDEEDLQQRRDVAEHLDIDGSDLANQPVRRQPPHPEDEADDGRQDDADHTDQQRIEQADPE